MENCLLASKSKFCQSVNFLYLKATPNLKSTKGYPGPDGPHCFQTGTSTRKGKGVEEKILRCHLRIWFACSVTQSPLLHLGMHVTYFIHNEGLSFPKLPKGFNKISPRVCFCRGVPRAPYLVEFSQPLRENASPPLSPPSLHLHSSIH